MNCCWPAAPRGWAPARSDGRWRIPGGDQEGALLHQELGLPPPGRDPQRGPACLAERTLTEAGKEHGFEVVASKDGRLFEPDKIGEWDAFAF